MKVFLSAVASLCLASSAFATTIVIPGTSDLWLAGQPPGTKASGLTPGSMGVDTSPAHRPVAVDLLVGQPYEFFATGCVSNGPTLPCYGPDGGPWLGAPTVSHYAGAENGIDDATFPLNSLIGLWHGTSTPFFLGSHYVFTAVSSVLYLGTMDGWEWKNNWGSFVVEWRESREIPNPVPESFTLLLVGIGVVLLGSRHASQIWVK